MDHSYALEIAETIRFHEEIRSLMRDELDGTGGGGSPLDPAEAAGGGSSFTALLGLAPHQAAELLGSGSAAFAAVGVKNEPEESGAESAGEVSGSRAMATACRLPAGKRKEPEKKVKSSSAKKSKSTEEEGDGKGGGSEKLPYVHVRARRGQATDSHSLAERARREKINARMKLLQELVPGCSKISGMALVLDEIINHVQALQRQVEFLSMKLAAVNPRIDFSGLDNFLAAENPRVTSCNGAEAVGLDVPLWAEVPMDGGVRRHPHLHRHQQQQIWQADMVPPQLPPSFFERSDHHHHHHTGLLSSGPSSFAFDTSNSSVALSVSQLKMETDL